MSESRTEIDLEDGRHLTINITHEGIILDVLGGEQGVSSVGMMFDEWADWVESDEPGGFW